jgi:hypothetical protein
LGSLVIYGADWTLRGLICAAFVAIELETWRALGIDVGEAVLSIEVGSVRAKRLLTNTGLAIEYKIPTIRSGAGDTLAVLEGEPRLTVFFDDTGAPSTLPEELFRTFGSL